MYTNQDGRTEFCVLTDAEYHDVIGIVIAPHPLHQGEWTHLITEAEAFLAVENQRLLDEALATGCPIVQQLHLSDVIYRHNQGFRFVNPVEYAV